MRLNNKENNNMFEILAFVFENCRQFDVSHDPDLVARKLSAAGFDDIEIGAALTWLAGVARTPQQCIAPLPGRSSAFRVFAPKERAVLTVECQGFLMSLEHGGILSPLDREHVVERALAAAGEALSLDQLKLIVLMVLWQQQAPASHLVAEELRTARGTRLPN